MEKKIYRIEIMTENSKNPVLKFWMGHGLGLFPKPHQAVPCTAEELNLMMERLDCEAVAYSETRDGGDS